MVDDLSIVWIVFTYVVKQLAKRPAGNLPDIFTIFEKPTTPLVLSVFAMDEYIGEY